jgi:hypothetical protein
VSWVYWLFLVAFVLTLVRLLRTQQQAMRAKRSVPLFERIGLVGQPILVGALFLVYKFAESRPRAFVVALTVLVTLAPFVSGFVEGLSDSAKARRIRLLLLLTIAALAVLVVLAFFVSVAILIVTTVAVVAVILLATILLGLAPLRHERQP